MISLWPQLWRNQPWPWALTIALLLVLGALSSKAEDQDVEGDQKGRNKKLLSVFQIVKFPNDVCAGSSRNGTCYTSDECSAKGGTSATSCADGFGVCCIFTLSCGGSSSENCTYLVQSAQTSWTESCVYTICKSNTNVCRIRFDFTSMTIDGPQTDTTAAVGADAVGTSTGDCISDTFSLTGANNAPPIICGTNTGQHMYVDALDACHKAAFNMDIGSSTSRSWDIKVTQYECGSQHGGPPGCLQYFTGDSGMVRSFNFPQGGPIASTVTHLSMQDYTMCFRRNIGKCYICFAPSISPAIQTATDQASFGLSISPSATIGQSAVDTACLTDYLEFQDAITAAIAAINTVNKGTSKICGRAFTTAAAVASTGAAIANSVCTRRVPFVVRFHTDQDEVGITTGTTTAITSENDTHPGGITGYSLDFTQGTC